MDQHLGVGGAAEAVAAALELAPQLVMVVDLAVADHPELAALVAHRLAAVERIDDGEAARRNPDVVAHDLAAARRAAARGAGRRARQGPGVAAVGAPCAAAPAHARLVLDAKVGRLAARLAACGGTRDRLAPPLLADAIVAQLAGVDEHDQLSDQPERSEEHTSELQSPCNLVCRLLLEKKKNKAKTSSSKTLENDQYIE